MAETKAIIQVPIERELLANLNRLSKSQKRPRAALIREACRRYLDLTEKEELDKRYEEGYRRLPEGSEIAEAQIGASDAILTEERW